MRKGVKILAAFDQAVSERQRQTAHGMVRLTADWSEAVFRENLPAGAVDQWSRRMDWARKDAGYDPVERSWHRAWWRWLCQTFNPTLFDTPDGTHEWDVEFGVLVCNLMGKGFNPADSIPMGLEAQLWDRLHGRLKCECGRRKERNKKSRKASADEENARHSGEGDPRFLMLCLWIPNFLWMADDKRGSELMRCKIRGFTAAAFTKSRQRMKLLTYRVAHAQPAVFDFDPETFLPEFAAEDRR